MKQRRPVLLVNPPRMTRDETVWHGLKGAMPPLSLLSIGAVLDEAGFEGEQTSAPLPLVLQDAALLV